MEQMTFHIRLTEILAHELLSHYIKILHVYLRFTNDSSLNDEWISSIKLLTVIFFTAAALNFYTHFLSLSLYSACHRHSIFVVYHHLNLQSTCH